MIHVGRIVPPAPRFLRRRLEGWERLARAEEADRLVVRALSMRDRWGLEIEAVRQMNRWVEEIHAMPSFGLVQPIGIGADVGLTVIDILGASNVQFWITPDTNISTSGGFLDSVVDRSSNAFNFSATGTTRPLYTVSDATLSNHATFTCDGVDDLLKNSIVVTNVSNVLSVYWWGIVKQVSWQNNAVLWQANSYAELIEQGSSPNVNFFYGGTSRSSSGAPIGVWVRASVSISDSANDFIQLGSGLTTGQAGGASTVTGFSFGGAFGGGQNANIAIGDFVQAKITPPPGTRALLDSYGMGRYPNVQY